MKKLLTCILLTAIFLSLFGCSEKNNVKSYDMKEEEFFNLLSRYADDAEMTLGNDRKNKKSVSYWFYQKESEQHKNIIDLRLDKHGNISQLDMILYYEYDSNTDKYVIPDDVNSIANRLIADLNGKEPEDIWESSFPDDAPKYTDGDLENSRYSIYYDDKSFLITFYAQ